MIVHTRQKQIAEILHDELSKKTKTWAKYTTDAIQYYQSHGALIDYGGNVCTVHLCEFGYICKDKKHKEKLVHV